MILIYIDYKIKLIKETFNLPFYIFYYKYKKLLFGTINQ